MEKNNYQNTKYDDVKPRNMIKNLNIEDIENEVTLTGLGLQTEPFQDFEVSQNVSLLNSGEPNSAEKDSINYESILVEVAALSDSEDNTTKSKAFPIYSDKKECLDKQLEFKDAIKKNIYSIHNCFDSGINNDGDSISKTYNFRPHVNKLEYSFNKSTMYPCSGSESDYAIHEVDSGHKFRALQTHHKTDEKLDISSRSNKFNSRRNRYRPNAGKEMPGISTRNKLKFRESKSDTKMAVEDHPRSGYNFRSRSIAVEENNSRIVSKVAGGNAKSFNQRIRLRSETLKPNTRKSELGIEEYQQCSFNLSLLDTITKNPGTPQIKKGIIVSSNVDEYLEMRRKLRSWTRISDTESPYNLRSRQNVLGVSSGEEESCSQSKRYETCSERKISKKFPMNCTITEITQLQKIDLSTSETSPCSSYNLRSRCNNSFLEKTPRMSKIKKFPGTVKNNNYTPRPYKRFSPNSVSSADSSPKCYSNKRNCAVSLKGIKPLQKFGVALEPLKGSDSPKTSSVELEWKAVESTERKYCSLTRNLIHSGKGKMDIMPRDEITHGRYNLRSLNSGKGSNYSSSEDELKIGAVSIMPRDEITHRRYNLRSWNRGRGSNYSGSEDELKIGAISIMARDEITHRRYNLRSWNNGRGSYYSSSEDEFKISAISKLLSDVHLRKHKHTPTEEIGKFQNKEMPSASVKRNFAAQSCQLKLTSNSPIMATNGFSSVEATSTHEQPDKAKLDSVHQTNLDPSGNMGRPDRISKNLARLRIALQNSNISLATVVNEKQEHVITSYDDDDDDDSGGGDISSSNSFLMSETESLLSDSTNDDFIRIQNDKDDGRRNLKSKITNKTREAKLQQEHNKNNQSLCKENNEPRRSRLNAGDKSKSLYRRNSLSSQRKAAASSSSYVNDHLNLLMTRLSIINEEDDENENREITDAKGEQKNLQNTQNDDSGKTNIEKSIVVDKEIDDDNVSDTLSVCSLVIELFNLAETTENQNLALNMDAPFSEDFSTNGADTLENGMGKIILNTEFSENDCNNIERLLTGTKNMTDATEVTYTTPANALEKEILALNLAETEANKSLILKLTEDDFNVNSTNTVEIGQSKNFDITGHRMQVSSTKTMNVSSEGIRDKKLADEVDLDVNGSNTVELSLPKAKHEIKGSANKIGIPENWSLVCLADLDDQGSNTKEQTVLNLLQSSLEGNEAEGENVNPNPYKDVVLMAKTVSGHMVEIKVDSDRPKSFKNDKARIMWDEAVYRNALKLKDQIEKGDFIPDDLKKELERKIQMKNEERALIKKDRILDKKKNKLKWLKLESRLVELDALVKSNLSLTKADPDRCLGHLDEISSLTIDPLMLKKHPQVVETIKKLRRYVGNISEWNFDDEQKTKFFSKANQIRDKADHIYNKFKAMFTVPEGRTFWQVFADHVTLFQQQTSHLSEDRVYALTVDPNVSKPTTESGSSEEEQAESQKCQKSQDEEERKETNDSEGEEENRAPELKKLASKDDARRR